jgi:hypothetical protein
MTGSSPANAERGLEAMVEDKATVNTAPNLV